MNDILNNTLAQLGKQLNCANIFWGVGASVMLSQYKLIDNPTDIDIVVSLNDISKVDQILSKLGDKKEIKGDDEVYKTSFFYEYIINGVEIDVMAGLKICHNGELFEYEFERKNSEVDYFKINGEGIPFMTLYDWAILYKKIPNRENKVKIIQDFIEAKDEL